MRAGIPFVVLVNVSLKPRRMLGSQTFAEELLYCCQELGMWVTPESEISCGKSLTEPSME